MIKVIVVDDHPVVREGLKRIIGESPEMTVVGEARDGAEALAFIRNVPCDVVLLDIALPQKSGLDILKELRAEKPRLPVLIVSTYAERQYAMRCLQAGAAGYLTKETVLAEVVQAVRRVTRGGTYVSQRFAERLVSDFRSIDRPAHEKLSDREYQVLCKIASGKTVTEIAIELDLSVKTISTYRVRILEKLGMKTNSDIMRYAIKQGLVD